MDIQHLRNFIAILDQNSISNAAILVRMSQPALSRQLHALEVEVGAPLLIRHPWGVAPTVAGEILAARARTIFQQLQLARDEISTATNVATGTLSVGVSASLASIILPQVVPASRKAMPNVKLRLYEGNSVILQERLLARELDLALIHARTSPPAFQTHFALREPVVAVGRAGTFRSEVAVSMNEMLKYTNLLAAALHGPLRQLYEEAARAAAPWTAFVEIDSFPTLLRLLADGEGVAVLAYSTIHSGVQAGHLSWAPFSPKPLRTRIILASHHERLETPAWRIMIDILRGIIESNKELLRWNLER